MPEPTGEAPKMIVVPQGIQDRLAELQSANEQTAAEQASAAEIVRQGIVDSMPVIEPAPVVEAPAPIQVAPVPQSVIDHNKAVKAADEAAAAERAAATAVIRQGIIDSMPNKAA
jgi:hypothetical protein